MLQLLLCTDLLCTDRQHLRLLNLCPECLERRNMFGSCSAQIRSAQIVFARACSTSALTASRDAASTAGKIPGNTACSARAIPLRTCLPFMVHGSCHVPFCRPPLTQITKVLTFSELEQRRFQRRSLRRSGTSRKRRNCSIMAPHANASGRKQNCECQIQTAENTNKNDYHTAYFTALPIS